MYLPLKKIIKSTLLICFVLFLSAKSIAQPFYTSPEGMVYGGAFIDRFQPAELMGELRSDVWGASNVIPRDVNNGIEDKEHSYWGGNIVVGDDGKNHLFVCRWPQDISNRDGSKTGHHMWWNSDLIHAVSDHPMGPYKVVQEIGKAHNPEIYRLKDGSYIIGTAFKQAYKGAAINGPWKPIEFKLDFLDDSEIHPGRSHTNKTNRTYVVREDGSILMMNKTGYLFEVQDKDEHFKQVTNKSCFPVLPEGAHLEDPVIWKDEVQYNLIVNDCLGRTALYLRSADGMNWKWEQGVAYDPNILKHSGGTVENWYKLERPKVRQDKYGRVTHMNFAAIDTTKNGDIANDNHSSKNIVVPMVVQRRLFIQNKKTITSKTKKIEVLIKAEEGFNPHTDIDLQSLKFGAAEKVNFGGGSTLLHSKKLGKDLILTFSGTETGITNENFAAKLIGKTVSGQLLFGYAKLPEQSISTK